MLQQTRVDNVIPYYERFMKKFPRLKSLARAKESQVLACWSGLGYYSRARNLHKTSKLLVSAFPETLDELQKLPGIGPYTAGAIASIAFDHPSPIFDGNVRRVLSRFFVSRNDTELKRNAEGLVRKAHREKVPPSVFNQALMELGALVCLPNAPRCSVCPIKPGCGALKRGQQNDYPLAKVRRDVITLYYALAVLRQSKNPQKILIVQRPQEERWLKGLWQPPMVAWDKTPSVKNFSLVEDRFKNLLGMHVRIDRFAGSFTHNITHHNLKIFTYLGTAGGVRRGRWLEPSRHNELSSSSILPKSLVLAGRI